MVEYKRNVKSLETVTLSPLEKAELVFEGLMKLGIIFFVYLTIVLVFSDFLDTPIALFEGSPTLRQMVNISTEFDGLLFAVMTIMVWIFIIRIVRKNARDKRDEIELGHVLDHLQYIAKGNYDHRIPESNNPSLNVVINNINILVESVVVAMEEQKYSEQTKNELITNIGHDIRTPLTSVIGYLGVIENERYNSKEELLDYVNVAYNKALHMQVLVNDLFEYTKTNQATFVANRMEIEVEMFLTQLAADFEINASSKGIDITIDVSPSDLVVSFDPEKMARAFNNLISNAIKYGTGASKIELIVKLREEALPENLKRLENPGNEPVVVFEVRNDGELIEEDELEIIFERSYRGDKSRTSEEPGSGLGLSIVEKIIEVHDGIIYAYLDDNKSCFRIEMPLSSEVNGNEEAK